MVRSVHVITGLATGGAEHSLLKLLQWSEGIREGGQVVSLRDQGTLGAAITALGVPVDSLGIRGPLPTPLSLIRLRRLIRRAAPGLIQGWMYHGNLAALAAARSGDPVIWNIRHSIDRLEDEAWWTGRMIQLGARLSRRPARIIYNSTIAARQHHAIGYVSDRAVIIPNGFDVARFAPSPARRAAFRESLGLAGDLEVVGHIGRYHPMKDHSTFLKAAARLLHARPRLHFLLAGSGTGTTNATLSAEVEALGLTDRVCLLGEVRDSSLIMASLDLLCLSSAWGEGFPNVVGEAMACEVPCVVTDVGDAGLLVAGTGAVVPRRDPVALAEAITRLLELDRPARQALGAAARDRILADYTMDRIAGRYEDLYAELLA